MRRLAGKVAVITGAGNGQGAAEAYLFAKEGAKVIATDIQYENVERMVEKINQEFPESAIPLKHDVSSEENWQHIAEEAVSQFGQITVLINNAAVFHTKPYTEVTFDYWNKALNVNAWGQFVGIKTMVPYMKKAGGGSIVNVGSIASRINASGFSPYTASKGAIEALTYSAASELGPDRIRVNAVLPGSTIRKTVKNAPTEESRQALINAIPARRIGLPEDVAHLVLFLASDESSYITGATNIIDGGLSVNINLP
ncbi:SDR family NAD(P)-dependent oxidoreductase [Pseudalkalibacillus decolorationis]|uniref:SDR family NAD(P)-dependent oxidoreductase n=1 Tax=Pseudalkalibacillus decolorationis TaxID=163879 RepID=UPI00214928D0|nr:SDR family oxidoreductase [Pseudalkalibacillus decolorationis]